MKTILRISAATVALASFAVSSAASAATATADAEAQILAALTVNLDPTDDTLDFGSIAESGSGGIVTVNPDGTYNCTAGLLCDGAVGVANFDVAGAANAVVSVAFTNGTITLQGPAAGDTMPVVLSTSAASLTLNGTGNGTFNVGGALTVGANENPGAYNGQLEVVVLYN